MAKKPTLGEIPPEKISDTFRKNLDRAIKAQEEAAAAAKAAASNQDNASKSMNNAAQNIKSDLEKSILKQSKILDSVNSIVNDVKRTLVDLVRIVEKKSSDSPDGGNKDGRKNKNYDTPKEVFESLIQINEGILEATKNNTEILYKILESFTSKNREEIARRRSDGGGRKPPPPPGPPPSSGGRGNNVNIGGSGVGGLLTGLGAAGAGLGAFFLGLAGADAIMAKFGDGENLKKLLVNLAEGLGAFQTRDLVAIGTMMGVGALLNRGGGNAIGIATGIGAVGFGIGAFFTGLAAGDAAMSWLSTDMEALKKATKGLSEALANLDTRALEVIGTLLVAGGAAGALFGPVNVGKATIGMGAIGLGIGSFFAGLAAGDAALTWMNVDGEKLTKMMKNMSEAFKAFTSDPASLAVLGGLLGTGAIAGLFGPSTVGTMGIGMGAIGLGIGAFFAGLGAGDAALKWMDVDGEKLNKVMKNVADGIKAFTSDPASLAVMGTLLGTSALFGATGMAGNAAIGLGAMGAGIGMFIAGLAGVAELAAWMGADGSGLKTILKNIAEGLAPFAELKGLDITGLAAGLGLLGPAMLAFLGSQGIASISEKMQGVWDWLTGGDSQGERKSRIRSIVDAIKPLAELKDIDVSFLEGFSSSLNTFTEAVTNLGSVKNISFERTFGPIIESIAKALPYLDVLAHGGDVEGSKQTLVGALTGDTTQNMPSLHIKKGKGLLDKSLNLDEMVDAMSKIRSILGMSGGNAPAPAPAAAPDKSQVKPAPSNQSANTNKINEAERDRASSGGAVVVNNSNVNNNYNGGAGAREPKIGGNINTSPPRSLIDQRLYGPPDMYAATP